MQVELLGAECRFIMSTKERSADPDIGDRLAHSLERGRN